jgi:hypothetical protein
MKRYCFIASLYRFISSTLLVASSADMQALQRDLMLMHLTAGAVQIYTKSLSF